MSVLQQRLTCRTVRHVLCRVLNARRIHEACLPGSGLLSSARALANVAAWLSDHDRIGGGTADDSCYGLGFRKFSFREADGRVRHTGFGHSALGGTVVFTDPAMALSVAITVNELTSDRQVVRDLVRFVCRELDVGTPLDV